VCQTSKTEGQPGTKNHQVTGGARWAVITSNLQIVMEGALKHCLGPTGSGPPEYRPTPRKWAQEGRRSSHILEGPSSSNGGEPGGGY